MASTKRKRPSAQPRPQEARPDRGPDGAAFRARPYALSRSAAVSRGSVAPGQAVELLRMTDTCLPDRMWGAGQLSDRQHRAAKCLLAMWTDAGLNPRVVAPCLYVQDVVFEVEEASEFHGAGPDPLAEDETWRDRFRAIMRRLGGHVAALLEGLLLGEHPGCRWLCTVQVALDELADGWGF